jgi:hypothetical protein
MRKPAAAVLAGVGSGAIREMLENYPTSVTLSSFSRKNQARKNAICADSRLGGRKCRNSAKNGPGDGRVLRVK